MLTLIFDLCAILAYYVNTLSRIHWIYFGQSFRTFKWLQYFSSTSKKMEILFRSWFDLDL